LNITHTLQKGLGDPEVSSDAGSWCSVAPLCPSVFSTRLYYLPCWPTWCI